MSRYSATVVEHFSSPRNLGRISSPDAQAFVGNPVCGDQVLLTATFDASAVVRVSFEARGCAASLALGSMLTTMLPGWDLERCDTVTADQIGEQLGGLSPEQRHVAELGREVVRRLADSRRTGRLDEECATCG